MRAAVGKWLCNSFDTANISYTMLESNMRRQDRARPAENGAQHAYTQYCTIVNDYNTDAIELSTEVA